MQCQTAGHPPGWLSRLPRGQHWRRRRFDAGEAEGPGFRI